MTAANPSEGTGIPQNTALMISQPKARNNLHSLPCANFQKKNTIRSLEFRSQQSMNNANVCRSKTRDSQEILIGCRQLVACPWLILKCAHAHVQTQTRRIQPPVNQPHKRPASQRNTFGHQLHKTFKVFLHCYGYFLIKAKRKFMAEDGGAHSQGCIFY